MTIFFDTSKVNARYKDTLMFQVKGKKLYSVGLSKDFCEKLKRTGDEHNKATGEHLEIPTFEEFDKQQSLTRCSDHLSLECRKESRNYHQLSFY